MSMSLDLIVVSSSLEPVDAAAVSALEQRLGIPMPPGYADFVATYGQGSVCNAFDVWGPTRFLDSLDGMREMWAEYWFWKHPELGQADFADAVPVGGSSDGDQLALVLGRGLVMLPRHSDEAIDVGTSYTDAVRWFCTSGRLVVASEVLWFASWARQSCYENWAGGELNPVRDAISALGVHVAIEASGADASTFLIPAMGGHVSVLRPSGDADLYVHVRFEPEFAALHARIEAALIGTGARRMARWGAEPVT
ncbi:SMI1/KNR4 family protein [Nocardia sp. NPDC056100]|uniref:SMI1/KNR4 family protein n=1 Tax=Nocardia sp. NPDC056100 TaxID=3345712 RepID=UPI0035E10B50